MHEEKNHHSHHAMKKQKKQNEILAKLRQVDCNLEEEQQSQIPSFWYSKEKRDEFVLVKICKQIEFYLSDANLRSDKFFREMLEKDPQIPLVVFLKCHKVNNLLSEQYRDSRQEQKTAIIALALTKSSILKLNKKETKVKRKMEFSKQSDTLRDLDNRTIYVEHLPKDVDNQLLYEIFRNVIFLLITLTCICQIDQVAEAKVSKFKESKRSKGFGFVTFTKENSTQLAVDKYNNCVPKEIQQKQLFTTGGLRVITKQDWVKFKEEANQLLKELKNCQKIEQVPQTQESHQLRLVGLRFQATPEEIRAALGHAAPQNLVKYVKVQNEIVSIECNSLIAINLLKDNIERIRGYSEYFSYCNLIDG